MLPSTLNSFKTQEFTSLIQQYEAEKKEILDLAGKVKDGVSVIHHFMHGNGIGGGWSSGRVFCEEGALKSLNSSYWQKAVETLKILPLMPAKARNEWYEMIHEMKTPDFTEDCVRATIMDLISKSGDFFVEKVEGVFSRLSDTHITNSPNAFRQKLIIASILDKFESVNYRQVEYLDDLRNIISTICGEEERKGWSSDLIYTLKNTGYGKWVDIDCNRLKVKLYKAGTLHIQVDEEVAVKLNRILASKYPMVISDDNRATKKSKKKTPVKPNSNKSIGQNIANKILELSRKRTGNFTMSLDLNKYEEKEFVDILNLIGIEDVKVRNGYLMGTKCEHHENALAKIGLSRMIPDYKMNQFYPTKEEIRDYMQVELDLKDDETLLEPSAGLGNLVEGLSNNKRMTLVEINNIKASILEDKGYYDVVEKDFLEFKKVGGFDKIIMNPPFSEGRAEAHLLHAIECLNHQKKGNKIVACLPSSFKGKEFSANLKHTYGHVFKDSFDNTSVSVVVLTLEVI